MTDPPPAPPAPAPVRLRLTRTVLLWWVGAAALLGLIGWFKTINLLLLLSYVLAALLLVNAWCAWRAARRPSARRRPTAVVFAGEEVVVAAEVSNPTRRPVTALVTDRGGENRSAWLFAPLGPGETREVAARWTFPRGGRYPVGPLAVEASYPFGLVSAVRELAPPGEVVVLPRVGAVDVARFREWLVRGGGSREAYTRRPARRPGLGAGEVRGVRPYRPGDPLRDIHWRTSARRGELLVREYDRGEALELVLVLDPWVPEGPVAPAAARKLEWALSLAASLALAWAEAEPGAGLTVIVPGDPPRVRRGPATPGFVRQALAPLADLTGTPAVPALPAGLLRRSRRAARLVASTRPASPLADAMRRAGLPTAAVDSSAPPAWFVPPPELA